MWGNAFREDRLKSWHWKGANGSTMRPSAAAAICALMFRRYLECQETCQVHITHLRWSTCHHEKTQSALGPVHGSYLPFLSELFFVMSLPSAFRSTAWPSRGSTFQ